MDARTGDIHGDGTEPGAAPTTSCGPARSAGLCSRGSRKIWHHLCSSQQQERQDLAGVYISLLIRRAQRTNKVLWDIHAGRKARTAASGREAGAQELPGASLLRSAGARGFSMTLRV